MIRLVVLLVAVVAAIVTLVVTREDDDPRQGSRSRQEAQAEEPRLPNVVMRRMPILEYAARGTDAQMTVPLASAINKLALEGQVPIRALAQVPAAKRIPLPLLNALPGSASVTVEDIERLAKEKELSEEATSSLSRDNLVTLEVLDALVADKLVSGSFVPALKELAGATFLAAGSYRVQDGVVLADTEILDVERDGYFEPLGGIEVHDSRGSIKVSFDRETLSWILPNAFGRAAQVNRLKVAATVLDGLGSADYRSSKKSFGESVRVGSDQANRVTLFDGQDQVITSLRIGMPFQREGRGPMEASTWVSPEDSDAVFLHDGRLAMIANTQISGWTDAQLFGKDVDPRRAMEMTGEVELLVLEWDDVQIGPPSPDTPERTGKRQRLVLTQEKLEGVEAEPNDLAKAAERKWTVQEPESAQATEVFTPMADQIVSMLLNARLADVVGNDPDNPSYGFETPLIDVSVSLKDGRTLGLIVGAPIPGRSGADTPPGQGLHYAQVKGSPYVVALAELAARGFQFPPDRLIDPSKKVDVQAPLAPPDQNDPLKPTGGG